ncbi:MAG: hypothetical protein V7785_05640 [Bermanella sp.]
MWKFTFSWLFLACLTTSVYAQSEYEAYLEQNTLDMQAAQQEFKNYLDENDKAFIGFLKLQWQEVEVKKPVVRDVKPKPTALPIAPIVKTPINVKPSVSEPIAIQPIATPKPIRPNPVVTSTPQHKNENTVTFNYFSHPIEISENKNLKQHLKGKINNNSIANYWTSLAKQAHKKTIKELKQKAAQLKLNDWGTAQLFNQYVKALGINSHNEQQLTTWFLLTKAGYNARIAFNKNAFLLLPSQQALYGVTYFTLKGTRFYALDLGGKSVSVGKAFTYSGNHGSGLAVMDFKQANKMLPSEKTEQRKFDFNYQGNQYSIKLDYDLGLVNYSNTIPQMDIVNYAKEGLPSNTAFQLLTQLKPIVEGQTEVEAVNRLMRFVQTGFAYKTDEEQFNNENYLFPIETLHYPYSDCEDRAALFAWLTKALLKLDVVLLDYPGHVAAAVAFNETVSGDAFRFKGKRYSVTDPTYINSTVGMSMPQLRNSQPEILRF